LRRGCTHEETDDDDDGAALAVAADKPDFSGTWKLNFDKSDFGFLGAPTANTLKIVHHEPEVKLDDEQTGGMSPYHVIVRFTTDGAPVFARSVISRLRAG
jgi:hypothetical protein